MPGRAGIFVPAPSELARSSIRRPRFSLKCYHKCYWPPAEAGIIICSGWNNAGGSSRQYITCCNAKLRKGCLSMRRLGELSELVGARLIGDPDSVIQDAKITVRASRDDITLANSPEHLQTFLKTDSTAAVVSTELDLESSNTDKSFLVVDNPESAFAEIVQLFRPVIERKRNGISPQANVSDSAEIAEDVEIMSGAFVGDNVKIGCGSVIYPNVSILENTVIGADTHIFPNAVIYENTVIGDRCLIHGGVVIGAYGFGYRSGAVHKLSVQLGNVAIGNDVEIGSNTTIDRGTYDSTTIGDGTKIDDQVMIGHNCQIGEHNLLCSQVGIAGSCTTGNYVVMAGQVGVGDHLDIGDKVTLAAQSGVMHNLTSNQVYLGCPAVPVREQMKIHAVVAKLPEMRKQLRQLQRDVDRTSISSHANTNSPAKANEAA